MSDGKRVENTRRFGPASELKTESAAWKKADEMGIRAEINKDSPDAGTFGVLALRYLGAETRDDAAVYYVRKVMIPAWGNAIADDIKRKDVREWLKTLDYSGPDNRELQRHHARRLRIRSVRGTLFHESV